VAVLSPLRAGDVAADGVAAALYASNLRFAAQATDYLQSELAPSPLLHLWSLGVEEQFYLFWPALLLLATRAHANRRVRVGILAVAVIVASFALSWWLTTANAPWAFFSLPTRAWELGIGALLAVGAVRLAALPRGLAAAAGWLGLDDRGVGAADRRKTPFPAPLPHCCPCSGPLRDAPRHARLDHGLAHHGRWRPARFLGRISYSLCLWHWPMLSCRRRLPTTCRRCPCGLA
jgi:peptidoglycan/LPS O-acetylase OafA/YrhL